MKHYIFFFLYFFVTACSAAYQEKSLHEFDHNYGSSELEQELIQQSLLARKQFDKDGMLVRQGAVANYINNLGQRLIPKNIKGNVSFNFFVLREPVPNAFAFPNGDIYLTYGLLSRYQTEAQIAFVLAHEISHVVERHSIEHVSQGEDVQVAAMIADVAVRATTGSSAFGKIAQLPFAAYIFAYSRESENEADAEGLRLIAHNGYKITDTKEFFEPLKITKHEGESALRSIWNTHADQAERVQITQALVDNGAIKRNAEGQVGTARYAPIQRIAVKESYDLLLSQSLYELTRDLAESERARGGDKMLADYYEGEAWRLSVEDPEGAAKENAVLYDKLITSPTIKEFQNNKEEYLQKAIDAYQKILNYQASFAKAYRGLGLSYYALDDQENAYHFLTRYLASGEEKFDVAYITSILNEIKGN